MKDMTLQRIGDEVGMTSMGVKKNIENSLNKIFIKVRSLPEMRKMNNYQVFLAVHQLFFEEFEMDLDLADFFRHFPKNRQEAIKADLKDELNY